MFLCFCLIAAFCDLFNLVIHCYSCVCLFAFVFVLFVLIGLLVMLRSVCCSSYCCWFDLFDIVVLVALILVAVVAICL